MRVVVYGGRDYPNRENVFRWLGNLFNPVYPNDEEGRAGTWLPRPDLHLIVGRAPGVDSFAEDWAVVHWVPYTPYEADWPKYGKSAGYIRNKQMRDEGKPDIGVAFPGGKGTANMTALLKERKIPILEIYE